MQMKRFAYIFVVQYVELADCIIISQNVSYKATSNVETSIFHPERHQQVTCDQAKAY